jgi:hypothetical protein
MEFSRCARDGLALREKAGPGPVSQNSTAFDVEVDVDLGELASRTVSAKQTIERDERPPE